MRRLAGSTCEGNKATRSEESEKMKNVRAIRALVVEDTGTEVRLLPQLPELWRGRTIDVLGLPVANGTMSFGLRWHGHRPALLWEASLAPEAPFTLKIPGIDAGFETSDRQGETLLTDPGWGSAS